MSISEMILIGFWAMVGIKLFDVVTDVLGLSFGGFLSLLGKAFEAILNLRVPVIKNGKISGSARIFKE